MDAQGPALLALKGAAPSQPIAASNPALQFSSCLVGPQHMEAAALSQDP